MRYFVCCDCEGFYVIDDDTDEVVCGPFPLAEQARAARDKEEEIQEALKIGGWY